MRSCLKSSSRIFSHDNIDDDDGDGDDDDDDGDVDDDNFADGRS